MRRNDMPINRKLEELINAITIVRPSLGGKKDGELKCFRFQTDRIRTFNGCVETMKMYPIGVDCLISNYNSAGASVFYEMLQKIPSASTHCEPTLAVSSDGKVLHIEHGGLTKWRLKIVPLRDFPPIRPFANEWYPLDERFRHSLEVTQFSASEYSSDINYCSAYVDANFVLTTDELRITKTDIKTQGKTPFLIPYILNNVGTILLNFKKILRYQIAKDERGKDLLVFDVGDDCYVFINWSDPDSYPVSKLLPHFKENLIYYSLPYREIVQHLNYVAIASNNENEVATPVDIEITEDKIIIASTEGALGTASSTVKFKRMFEYADIPKLKMKIDPNYFRDCLMHKDVEFALPGDNLIEFKTPDFRCVFKLFELTLTP